MSSSELPTPEAAEEAPHGLLMWAALVVGWAGIVFGLHGLVEQSNPPAVLRLLIGANIVNDAIVVPIVLLVAVGVRHVLPGWLRVPVDVGLIASAVVTLYAYPLVGSWGKSPRAGFSRLPWNYAHGLAAVLCAVWLVCGVLALWSWRRAHSASA